MIRAEPVRATVLANGGKAGSVDLEGEKIGGKAVYEAVGKVGLIQKCIEYVKPRGTVVVLGLCTPADCRDSAVCDVRRAGQICGGNGCVTAPVSPVATVAANGFNDKPISGWADWPRSPAAANLDSDENGSSAPSVCKPCVDELWSVAPACA